MKQKKSKEIFPYQPLSTLINNLRFSISSEAGLDSLEKYLPILHDNAATLYDKLFRPLWALEELPNRLIIVRDDSLEYVPFGVLLTNRTKQKLAFGQFPYLIKEKALSYAFSVTLLHKFMKNFMGHVYNKEPKDLSLQSAQRVFASTEHPYYWAAYEMRGDTRQIAFTAFSFTRYWPFGVGIILLFIMFKRIQRLRPVPQNSLVADQKPQSD